MPPTETSALLHAAVPSKSSAQSGQLNRVYWTSALLSMTFAITQTSMIYSFKVMSCEAWYGAGRDMTSAGDKCSLAAIDAKAAREIALMSTITTTCTIFNLFFTGFLVQRYGPKAALFQQTAWAAGRNLCQIWALHVGGQMGMRMIQTSQLFNLMGSGGGYLLASNAFVAALSSAEQRTSAFGKLQGIVMLGAAVGYTFGGLAEHYFGRFAPFKSAFVLLVFCSIFGFLYLPFIAPSRGSDNLVGTKTSRFVAPLKIYLPVKRQVGNTIRRDSNLSFLAAGTFFSTLATGYVAMALQLVGQNVFGFLPADNGFMLTLDLLARAIFLSIVFPWVIEYGRRRMSLDRSGARPGPASQALQDPLQAATPDNIDAPNPEPARKPADERHGWAFDLIFLRWSIFLDGAMTACFSSASHGWHLYLASIVLPFASGTGPASKGVILDMVDPEHREDALAGITLIERLAQVLTTSLFGYVFSVLSELNRPLLVFLANAGVAMIGFTLLCFVRMRHVALADATAP